MHDRYTEHVGVAWVHKVGICKNMLTSAYPHESVVVFYAYNNPTDPYSLYHHVNYIYSHAMQKRVVPLLSDSLKNIFVWIFSLGC